MPIAQRQIRHVYSADDTAVLIYDWYLDGTGSDGTSVHVEGTATDIVRRGSDGRYRYIIDNPFGIAPTDRQ